MKLHKRYPLNRLSVVNTTTLLLLMGCAGVGRKPTEAPIELEAAPTSVDGYLAHLSYDENTPFQTNQELYDVDIVHAMPNKSGRIYKVILTIIWDTIHHLG